MNPHLDDAAREVVSESREQLARAIWDGIAGRLRADGGNVLAFDDLDDLARATAVDHLAAIGVELGRAMVRASLVVEARREP